MDFFVPMIPPTRTEQQHRVFFANGRPIFYRDPKLREARRQLEDALAPFQPAEPISGPVAVDIVWAFPYRKTERKSLIGEPIPKDTRPDIDNLNKNLLDVMNNAFLNDDAQIVSFTTSKCWYETPGIYISINPLDAEEFRSDILQKIKNKNLEE